MRRVSSKDQSAGVSPRAELALWGGRRAVNGRKVGPRGLAESSWRRGRAHFHWLVSGFCGERTGAGMDRRDRGEEGEQRRLLRQQATQQSWVDGARDDGSRSALLRAMI